MSVRMYTFLNGSNSGTISSVLNIRHVQARQTAAILTKSTTPAHDVRLFNRFFLQQNDNKNINKKKPPVLCAPPTQSLILRFPILPCLATERQQSRTHPLPLLLCRSCRQRPVIFTCSSRSISFSPRVSYTSTPDRNTEIQTHFTFALAMCGNAIRTQTQTRARKGKLTVHSV